MILLLGGTAETAPLAEASAAAGYRVLVSTATDIPLAVGSHPNILQRRGPLTEPQMAALVRERQIKAIVDATHPYASHVRATARRVASAAGIPCLTYVRPGALSEQGGVRVVADHAEAARVACEAGQPILLTIGSKNVRPYVEAARRVGVPLAARVLARGDSIQTCRDAGIPDERIITGRGPFSVDENRRLLRQFGVGTLVTKDSGKAGGVPEKLEAARLEGCCVIVVGRPPQPGGSAFDTVAGLVNALLKVVATDATARVKDRVGVT